MKTAQDYLGSNVSGESLGGFNSRLFGDSRSKCMGGIHSGDRWAKRNAGWELAESMILKGEIFSVLKFDSIPIEFKCSPDGDSWCCVGAGFENLQESDNYAFGDSRIEAIEGFVEKYQGRKK